MQESPSITSVFVFLGTAASRKGGSCFEAGKDASDLTDLLTCCTVCSLSLPLSSVAYRK